MDASYVNSFVQGAQRVFSSLHQEVPALGKIFLKKNPYTTDELTVSVGIVGAFEGEVVYNMKPEAGCFFASCMMMGMPVDSLDAMAMSAICELANIISGNVATIFAGKEVLVDIKPPALKLNATAADFPLAEKLSAVVCVPLHFKNGHTFEIDVLVP
jgi:chemotaxis protein CheX